MLLIFLGSIIILIAMKAPFPLYIINKCAKTQINVPIHIFLTSSKNEKESNFHYF